jgi:nickel transport protein
MKTLLLLSLLGFAAGAQAHKVNVFAYTEGDQVYVEGYFSDGTRAKNSEVTVSDHDGRQLIQGKTDEKGDFIFPVTERQALHITLNAGQGHQSTFDIPLDEIAGDDPPPTPSSTMTAAAAEPASADPVSAGDATGVSEAMVRKAVAQGVLPLAREISALKERRGLSDIVGGIGLIMGILGIFAYFRGRQELQRLKAGKDA